MIPRLLVLLALMGCGNKTIATSDGDTGDTGEPQSGGAVISWGDTGPDTDADSPGEDSSPDTSMSSDSAGSVDADQDGYTANEDCDDFDNDVYPGAAEECNGEDEDCDGDVDEGVTTTYFADADGDGFGDSAETEDACSRSSGYVENDEDCDDSDAAVNPSATEECDGDDIDEDCNGLVNDDDPGMDPPNEVFQDADGDSYGDPDVSQMVCETPSGYVLDDTDCDDANADANPLESEVCDDVDNDCNGTVDDGVETTFYADADGDGYGDVAVTTSDCSAPAGYVGDATDCDDTSRNASPADYESCDGLDNDCNGSVDDGGVCDDVDQDGDGVTPAVDCDDEDATVSPLLAENCTDEVDNDCDGLTDEIDEECDLYADDDGDGMTDMEGDCDDADPIVYDGAEEVDDEQDNDCDGISDEGTDTYDDDGDGVTEADGDCDDADAMIYYGATETCDYIDTDCDGTVDEGCSYIDADGDGVTPLHDCDDEDATISPLATEVCDDGVDQDCDGSDETCTSEDTGDTGP